ncbi:MAG: hypothetical protein HQL77_18950 [Magnetococcales bacterium]|nr:hypothetical protein [Magnetococcales bacterium]
MTQDEKVVEKKEVPLTTYEEKEKETMGEECNEEEKMFHKGVVKDIIHEEMEKHTMTGIDPAVVALLQNNKGGLFGGNDGGGVLGGLVLAGLLGGNRNGIFGNNNGDAAAAVAVANPQFAALSQQMQTLGQNLAHLQGETADAQRANAAEHRVDSLEEAMTGQHVTTLNEINAIARNQSDMSRSLADCCCEQRLATQGINTNLALMESRLNAQLCQMKQDIMAQASAHEAAAVARNTQNIISEKDATIFKMSQDAQTAQILAALSGNGNGKDK